MWLLIAFVAVPILEIWLFLQVGEVIGTWPTIGIVILTAVLGSYLMRVQGALAMNSLRQSFGEMRDPTEPLAHGAMILVAGVLLLTPGFFTDSVGISLLMPPVRAAVIRYVSSRMKVQSYSVHTQSAYDPRPNPSEDVIDGDYQEVSPSQKKPDQPSGWTKD
ncbi:MULTISPECIES: FxsA family protein [Halocynthiibacter]|uniref:FxsA family protein n=1 Tax=Halocynthiibacter halioticoli TaxID=2986804 RepID=A0AAE3J1G9_9RHOB|nr:MULTISPECIES: FxsA family protein [Halocynthiibacter]MCV6825619.1 FxsA family protein [Halocynthiibacter halioticoli]MCW4058620.1 FxsA family protein [Halocynthiibacter sp. SDUM655004]MDE0591010.1 FxsA family protein [Halocynthiibacter sp. C4]